MTDGPRGVIALDWEALSGPGPPWSAPADIWQVLLTLAGAVSGAAMLSDPFQGGAFGGAAIGLMAARWIRSRSQVPLRRAAYAVLLAVAASLMMTLGVRALAAGYRWDLRSPSLGQIVVAAAAVRGGGGAALLLLPALMQPNTPRWVPAVPCGWAAGTLGAWLFWPVNGLLSQGAHDVPAAALWTALVLVGGFLGEHVYSRLPGARWMFRRAVVAGGVVALVVAAMGWVVRQPLVADRQCSGPVLYSFSSRWGTEASLAEICSNLQALPHAGEWLSLNRVVLLEGTSRQSADVLGVYMPPQLAAAQGARIELYQVEVADRGTLARVLAHEYGHHFTTYHLKSQEGLDWAEFRRSLWARVRGIDQLSGVGEADGPYPLRASEIAAEDYAVLFGGATDPTEVFQVPWTKAGIPRVTDRPEARTYWEEVLSKK
jgi:hypothetical protein